MCVAVRNATFGFQLNCVNFLTAYPIATHELVLRLAEWELGGTVGAPVLPPLQQHG